MMHIMCSVLYMIAKVILRMRYDRMYYKLNPPIHIFDIRYRLHPAAVHIGSICTFGALPHTFLKEWHHKPLGHANGKYATEQKLMAHTLIAQSRVHTQANIQLVIRIVIAVASWPEICRRIYYFSDTHRYSPIHCKISFSKGNTSASGAGSSP